MPYASKAQQGLFHSANSPVSKKVVAEFDKASKGHKNLPDHVHHHTGDDLPHHVTHHDTSKHNVTQIEHPHKYKSH
jgi:capsular polysaccharide biosynthesis protein